MAVIEVPEHMQRIWRGLVEIIRVNKSMTMEEDATQPAPESLAMAALRTLGQAEPEFLSRLRRRAKTHKSPIEVEKYIAMIMAATDWDRAYAWEFVELVRGKQGKKVWKLLKEYRGIWIEKKTIEEARKE